MPLDLFGPFGTDTTALSVSSVTGSAALTLPGATSDLSGASSGATRSSNIGGVSVRVYNATSVTVFIQFGDSTVAATTAKMPIPAGAVETIQIGRATTHVAGITASGTGTLYVTPGMGA